MGHVSREHKALRNGLGTPAGGRARVRHGGRDALSTATDHQGSGTARVQPRRETGVGAARRSWSSGYVTFVGREALWPEC